MTEKVPASLEWGICLVLTVIAVVFMGVYSVAYISHVLSI
jgi:hypothetical protein